ARPLETCATCGPNSPPTSAPACCIRRRRATSWRRRPQRRRSRPPHAGQTRSASSSSKSCSVRSSEGPPPLGWAQGPAATGGALWLLVQGPLDNLKNQVPEVCHLKGFLGAERVHSITSAEDPLSE